MRSLYQRINKYVPLWTIIIFLLSIVSIIIYLACALSSTFADFFNLACAPIRAILSSFSSLFPFSIIEAFIIFTPFILAMLIYFAVKVSKMGDTASIRYLFVIISIPLFYFISFVWTFASGYYIAPIETKLEISRESITKDELYNTLEALTVELNSLSNQITYDENGASVLPYSYDEMSEKISKAYKNMASDTKLLKTFNSRAKPLLTSKLIAYTHISGVYVPITGEININTAYSDYMIASTTAHEMAHQRGIAREDEASFVGFLALMYSDDSFLKYSAYIDVYYYLLSDLSKTSLSLANDVYSKLNTSIKTDRDVFVKSFEKYKDSTISKLSNKINDTYLHANGEKHGTNSYNLVSELVCAYFVKKYNIWFFFE